ncbi:Hypothetical predicted protein [Paramuricea clavata]|uniref:Uncharacterized protein n=1 Tax=Paramuricea clavata TaxID=317549 RepID=A0A7D9IUI0_PARCT|nr:Hypothetical predicted protein [Paramuricea clavata]
MSTATHQTQSSNINRYPELKLSWSGDYESLKLFVDSELNFEGTWSSIGGEKKLFKSKNVDIHWWAKKKFLRIEGKQASEVKRSILMLILHDIGSDDHNIRSSHNMCKCPEVSSDIEGVKLDVIILESTVKQQANTLVSLQDVITPTCLYFSDEPEQNNTDNIIEKQNNTDSIVETLVGKYLPSHSKSNVKNCSYNTPILKNPCHDLHHNPQGIQDQLNTSQRIEKECVEICQSNTNKRYFHYHGQHNECSPHCLDLTVINPSNSGIITDDTTPMNNYQSIPTRITQRKPSRKHNKRNKNSGKDFRARTMLRDKMNFYKYYY